MRLALKIVVAPVWVLGMALMAVGTYMVLASEWVCEDLRTFWS
jgi:hypothetical protein